MTARRLPCLWVIAALLGVSLPAIPAAAQRGAEGMLVLGLQRAGKFDAKLTHALYEYLAKSGEVLRKESVLALPERLCANEECMSMLASREDAKIVLSGQVQDTSPTSQYVTVALFDVERRVPVEEKTICDHCSASQLQAAVRDLADRLLRGFRARNPLAPPSPPASAAQLLPAPATPDPARVSDPTQQLSGGGAQAPQVGLAAPPTPNEPPGAVGTEVSSPWSPKRKVAAGVLTGLLIATLIPTLALQVTNGQETSIIGCGSGATFCVLQNRPLYAAGYGISGALAIGLGITLLWPSAKPASSPGQSPSSATAPEGN